MQQPHQSTFNPVQAVRKVTLAMLEAIQEAGDVGAPEGVLFAALQTQGCTLNQFQSLLRPLLDRGFIQRDGHILTITSTGAGHTSKLRQMLQHTEPQR